MGIHQVLVSASAGDAVTNAALALRDVLQRIGDSVIYARYIDPRLEDEVSSLGLYAGGPGDVLVYHASIGEPAVVDFLLERPEPLVLMYHNITPAKYFTTLDPAFAHLLAVGRAELEVLRSRAALALAVSPYNAAELEALGYPDVRVSPLPIDLAALREVTPDEPMTKHLEEGIKGPLVLFVGQLLPHKRPDLVLTAFHTLITYLLPDAQLALVGGGRSAAYRGALERLIAELSLPARTTGWVSDGELVALYRKASLFVTMSEHEGVCVPLLEAMAFDVPVIARAFAAIPDTVGEAGLVLPTEDDPLLVAEAMFEVLANTALAQHLVELGRKRVDDFDPQVAQATFLRHIAEVI